MALGGAALPALDGQGQDTGLQQELTEERLRVLAPVLERRRAQLKTLRAYPLADSVAPTPGLLRKW